MFGENMYGNEEMKVDAKGRVKLPAFTNSEQGDQILLVKDDEYYSLFLQSYYDALLSKYKNVNDLNTIRSLCEQVLKNMKVDSFGRINLGVEFANEKILKVIGCKNFISLRQVKER